MFQIESTATLSLEHGLKMLVYGRSGVGKTSLARTAPQPLILSAEKGLLSLAGVDIPVIRIDSFAKLVAVQRWLMSGGDSYKFRTIILDSLSDIAEVLLAEEKPRHKDPRKAYVVVGDQIFDMIRGYRDLMYRHVVFLAKEEESKDDNGAIMRRPMMPGNKVGQNLAYYWDFVLQMGIGGVTGKTFRYLRTQPDFQHEAKDRSGKLAELEQPNLGELFAKVLGQPPAR